MTIFEDMERWMLTLGPHPERRPTFVKVSPDTYHELATTSLDEPYDWKSKGAIGNPTHVAVILVHDLKVPWIMYDQYHVEMKRAD